MRIKWFAALLACATLAAHAAGDTGAAAPARPAAEDRVCTYETPVGSHVKKRVCHTRAAREDRAAKDREALQKRQHGAGRPSGDAATR